MTKIVYFLVRSSLKIRFIEALARLTENPYQNRYVGIAGSMANILSTSYS
jgi:hypothetical protein